MNKILHPHMSIISNNACIYPHNYNVISILETVEKIFMDYKMNIGYIYSNSARKLLEVNLINEFIETTKRNV